MGLGWLVLALFGTRPALPLKYKIIQLCFVSLDGQADQNNWGIMFLDNVLPGSPLLMGYIVDKGKLLVDWF